MEISKKGNIISHVEGRMMLRAEGLVKRYGKRTVVNNVHINVRQGEIVGLLGPNGAGKTTSFYMTTGLVVPNGGRIFLSVLNDEGERVDDLDITGYPVYKRARAGIGYLPQEASVFRKLSVEDNIMAVLEMTDMSRQAQVDKLESLIREFRLETVRKNLGDRLSGGERRRTEIARCLAIDPKFIMLDEPFAGVDPIAVEDIQKIVWQLKDRNIGILITDHNVQETLCITDRAYLLFEGTIFREGTPEELATDPVVLAKYLSTSFVLRKKDFQLMDAEDAEDVGDDVGMGDDAPDGIGAPDGGAGPGDSGGAPVVDVPVDGTACPPRERELPPDPNGPLAVEGPREGVPGTPRDGGSSSDGNGAGLV